MSKISDGLIRKICDREIGWSPIFRNEVLYFTSLDDNGTSQVVKVGPSCPLKIVLENPPSHLAAVGPNEELGFGWFGVLGGYSMKFPGKPIVKMPGNDFSINFYPSSKGVFPVGTAYSIQGGVKTNYPSMYAQDGSYVQLKELCPELKSKMVHLDDMYSTRYGYSKDGYLALEISGAVKDASTYNSSNHVSTPWMEGTRITKTYVLQEIR